jgi:hypothetical protein
MTTRKTYVFQLDFLLAVVFGHLLSTLNRDFMTAFRDLLLHHNPKNIKIKSNLPLCHSLNLITCSKSYLEVC